MKNNTPRTLADLTDKIIKDGAGLNLAEINAMIEDGATD